MTVSFDPHKFSDPDLIEGPNAAFKDPDDVELDEPATPVAPQENVESRPLVEGSREDPSFLHELGQSTKAFSSGVIQGVKHTGQMVGRAGIKAAGMLGIEDPAVAKRAVSMMDEDVAEEKAKQSYRDQQQFPGYKTPLGVGKFVGKTAPYGAIPGGATGGLLRRVATGAAGGAVAGYVNDNTLLGTVLGGGVPGLLGAIKGIKGWLFPSKTQAAQEVVGEIARTGQKQTEEVLSAAQRTGVKVTPAEATGSPILATMEKGARVSKAKQAEIASTLEARSQILNQKTKQLVTDMVPEGDEVAAALSNKLYKEVDATALPPPIMDRLKQNPIIKKALSIIKKDPAYRVDLQKPGTVGELRAANDAIADLIKGAAPKAKTNLIDARVKLTKELDAIAPQYAQARAIQQRIILKDKTIKQLDKITKLSGKNEATLDQTARALWGTPTKQKSFLEAVQVSGGNVQQAKDVIRLISATSKSPLKMLAGKKPAGMPLTGAREISAMIMNTIGKVRTGLYNKGLVNLMLDPKWSQEVARAAANNSPAAFAALATKAAIGHLPAENTATPKQTAQTTQTAIGSSKIEQTDMPKDHIREAIQEGIQKVPALKAEMKELPKETVSTIEELLQMDEKEYYEKYLDTPEKRQAYLKNVADAGGNTAAAAKLLRELTETDAAVKEAKNSPAVDSNISIGQLILMFVSALFGGATALSSFVDVMAPFVKAQEKSRQAREADIKKLIKTRRSAVSGLLTNEIGIRTQQ